MQTAQYALDSTKSIALKYVSDHIARECTFLKTKASVNLSTAESVFDYLVDVLEENGYEVERKSLSLEIDWGNA